MLLVDRIDGSMRLRSGVVIDGEVLAIVATEVADARRGLCNESDPRTPTLRTRALRWLGRGRVETGHPHVAARLAAEDACRGAAGGLRNIESPRNHAARTPNFRRDHARRVSQHMCHAKST
jgi:hypothetical protein